MSGGEWLDQAMRWGAQKARTGVPAPAAPCGGTSPRDRWAAECQGALDGLAASVIELRDLAAMPASEVPAAAILEVVAEANRHLARISEVTRG